MWALTAVVNKIYQFGGLQATLIYSDSEGDYFDRRMDKFFTIPEEEITDELFENESANDIPLIEAEVAAIETPVEEKISDTDDRVAGINFGIAIIEENLARLSIPQELMDELTVIIESLKFHVDDFSESFEDVKDDISPGEKGSEEVTSPEIGEEVVEVK